MPDKMDDFVKVIVEKLECKNPTVICGFPGMGLVGNIVAQFLMDQFKMTTCGHLNPAREIVMVFSDIPIDPLVSGEVGRSVIEWVKTINPREVVSIAGLATTGTESRIFVAGATPEDLERVKDNAQIFEVGTISGVPGVIMNECRNNNIPAICLLGETRGANPDPRAAAELVKALSKIYGWDINIDILLKEADQIEQVMHKLSEQVGEAEAKPSKDYNIYG
jgi:uncharacterized protein